MALEKINNNEWAVRQMKDRYDQAHSDVTALKEFQAETNETVTMVINASFKTNQMSVRGES